jgi:hypothetical protein
MRVLLLIAFMLAVPATGAAAERLRIASWHIPDLWHEPGKALTTSPAGGSTIRDKDDFEALKALGERLDADVIALQSIGSPQAARRVLPAADYHLVFSRQLALRAAEDARAFSDPSKRTGYTAIAVRRDRALRVQRVMDVPELALSGASGGASTRTPAGIAVEIRAGGERLWLLAVDLDRTCSAAGPGTTADCPTLRAQVEVLGEWVDGRLGEDASYVIAGTLNRGIGTGSTAGGAEPLWGRLDRAQGSQGGPETIVVLAGEGEGEAPPASDTEEGPSRWSATPWKYLKLDRKERRSRASEPPEPPPVAGGGDGVGVGRMAERAASSRTREPPPATAWDIVSAAFRELFATAREERQRRRNEEAAAERKAKTEALLAARKLAHREALGLGPEPDPIPPLPVRKPDPLDLLAGDAPRLAIGARLARFPDGRGRNPCQEGADRDTATAGPPLDYILLDRRLTEGGGLAGFGVLPGSQDGVSSEAGTRHCPVFVDLHF